MTVTVHFVDNDVPEVVENAELGFVGAGLFACITTWMGTQRHGRYIPAARIARLSTMGHPTE